jgi:hypothetical protein
LRITIGQKSLAQGKVELKKRTQKDAVLVDGRCMREPRCALSCTEAGAEASARIGVSKEPRAERFKRDVSPRTREICLMVAFVVDRSGRHRHRPHPGAQPRIQRT